MHKWCLVVSLDQRSNLCKHFFISMWKKGLPSCLIVWSKWDCYIYNNNKTICISDMNVWERERERDDIVSVFWSLLKEFQFIIWELCRGLESRDLCGPSQGIHGRYSLAVTRTVIWIGSVYGKPSKARGFHRPSQHACMAI